MSFESVLRLEYELARRATSDAALFAPGTAPSWACRYCGKRRFPCAGSDLDGHARCLVTPAFRAVLLDVLETHPCKSLRAVRELLDATEGTVRAWVEQGRDERAARGLPVVNRRRPDRGALAGLEPWVRLAIAGGDAMAEPSRG